jgi:hypothetical protein
VDIVAVGRVLRRQWKVVVPCLVLGASVTVYALVSIPDTYRASGAVVITADKSARSVTPQLIAEAVQNNTIQASVAKAARGSYTAEAYGDGFIRITSTADDATSAVRVTNTALDNLEPVVKQRLAAIKAPQLPVGVEIINRPRGAVLNSAEQYSAVGSARLTGVGDPAMSNIGAAGLLASSLDSNPVRDLVDQAGGDPEYVITAARSVPTIGIEATGTTKEEAVANVKLIMTTASGQLTQLVALSGSEGAPLLATAYVTPTDAQRDATGLMRSMFALVTITFALALAMAFLFEAVIAPRRQKKSAPRAARVPAPPSGRRSASSPKAAAPQRGTASASAAREDYSPPSPERSVDDVPGLSTRRNGTDSTYSEPHTSTADRH